MIASSARFFSIAFMALLVCATSFTVQSDTTRTSSLNAWSLQMPSSFGKSTWYDEVDCPTARTRVYSDAPDFRFVTAGSDWPELEEPEKPVESQPQQIGFNPIRRAARWISRRRRS